MCLFRWTCPLLLVSSPSYASSIGQLVWATCLGAVSLPLHACHASPSNLRLKKQCATNINHSDDTPPGLSLSLTSRNAPSRIFMHLPCSARFPWGLGCCSLLYTRIAFNSDLAMPYAKFTPPRGSGRMPILKRRWELQVQAEAPRLGKPHVITEGRRWLCMHKYTVARINVQNWKLTASP